MLQAVIALHWLPTIERAEFNTVKLAWKSINYDGWPKFANITTNKTNKKL